MQSLTVHLRRVEAALAADDAQTLFELLRELDDTLGKEATLAVISRLVEERTARRRAVAAVALGAASCA